MKPARRRPTAPQATAADPAFRSDRGFLQPALGIFLLALALRLVHVWQLRRSPFFDVLLGDAHGYDEWARRIAGGEWIGTEVFYQAPLYPYFLGTIYAAVGHSLLAVRVVQATLGAASCAVLGLAAQRFFTPKAGLAAGVMLAVYAPAIFFDGLLQKSVLDVFFLSLALWIISLLLDRPGSRREWLALGLSMGALSLTRENALVFIVIILGWCVWTRGQRGRFGDRLKPAAAFVAGLAIVLLPVAIRNYAVGGGFYLTTAQFGPNFFIGNNARSDGTYMSLRFGRGAPEYERQDATELAEHAVGRSLTPAQVSSYWTSRALDFITAHPGAWLRLMGRKFLLLWNGTEMLDTESQESYADWSLPLRLGGWFGHFGVLVPLALAGAMLAWPNRRRLAILYAMTIAYAASVLLFYVFARYRLPLVPLLTLFAADAIVQLPSRLRSWRARGSRPSAPALASAVAVLGIAVVLANWPVLSTSLMKAITENNLATALQAEGRTDDALAHFERAIAIQPDYAPAYNNMGVALRARGDTDRAIASYERALSVQGDYPDAHYNLANALLEQHKPAEAAEHFKVALESIPDSAGVRNNLGIALAAEGKRDDAVSAFRAAVAADPSSATAHRNLGDALSSVGQIEEAIAELRRATALDPADTSAHYNLGVVLLEQQRFGEAASEFRIVLRLTPASLEGHNNLGIALASQGQLDAAIEQFQQAVALDPTFVDAQRNLAMARQAAAGPRGERR